MVMASPYITLGIEPGSSPNVARVAFHAVAKTCHPDVNPDPAARERFLEAQRAYRAITVGAASADKAEDVESWSKGNSRIARMVEIDVAVSVWIAARGGSVRGSCSLGKASVRVPVGSRSGDRIITRIGGKDVTCVLRVAESDGFIADGGDLTTSLRLSSAQARQGGGVEIETPLGRLRVNVPRATPDGARLKVEGKGLPARGERSAGDLYLDVEIVETATDKAVAALDKILALAKRPRAAAQNRDVA
jgi:DnaJ-class molecular chaperone